MCTAARILAWLVVRVSALHSVVPWHTTPFLSEEHRLRRASSPARTHGLGEAAATSGSMEGEGGVHCSKNLGLACGAARVVRGGREVCVCVCRTSTPTPGAAGGWASAHLVG